MLIILSSDSDHSKTRNAAVALAACQVFDFQNCESQEEDLNVNWFEMPNIVNVRPKQTKLQSNSLCGLSAIAFSNRTKLNSPKNWGNQTQSNI